MQGHYYSDDFFVGTAGGSFSVFEGGSRATGIRRLGAGARCEDRGEEACAGLACEDMVVEKRARSAEDEATCAKRARGGGDVDTDAGGKEDFLEMLQNWIDEKALDQHHDSGTVAAGGGKVRCALAAVAGAEEKKMGFFHTAVMCTVSVPILPEMVDSASSKSGARGQEGPEGGRAGMTFESGWSRSKAQGFQVWILCMYLCVQVRACLDGYAYVGCVPECKRAQA